MVFGPCGTQRCRQRIAAMVSPRSGCFTASRKTGRAGEGDLLHGLRLEILPAGARGASASNATAPDSGHRRWGRGGRTESGSGAWLEYPSFTGAKRAITGSESGPQSENTTEGPATGKKGRWEH